VLKSVLPVTCDTSAPVPDIKALETMTRRADLNRWHASNYLGYEKLGFENGPSAES
jgi:hypothetical protein